MPRLQIIVGSTRPTRAADVVAPWVAAEASSSGRFDDVEVLDLRDWNLPMFAEHFGTLGDLKDPTYSDPVVRAWNHKIKQGDAYLIVTPEYNHGIPGVLKNALDTVWVSFAFRHKPVAFVGYSSGLSGAMRAIEHLVQVFVEAEAVPLRTSVLIPTVGDAFDGDQPRNPATLVSMAVALEDLAWWAGNLNDARARGELVPAAFRARAALAALTG